MKVLTLSRSRRNTRPWSKRILSQIEFSWKGLKSRLKGWEKALLATINAIISPIKPMYQDNLVSQNVLFYSWQVTQPTQLIRMEG